MNFFKFDIFTCFAKLADMRPLVVADALKATPKLATLGSIFTG